MGAAALPWKEIIKGATVAVSLARGLMKQQPARPAPPGEPGADPRAQLADLAQRVAALEAANAEQAKVVKVLAEEVQNLARRAMIGYRLGIAGLVIAIVAVAVAAYVH